MQAPEIYRLIAALAAVCDTEGRDAASRTAQSLRTTPAPVALAPRPPAPMDAEIRALLAASPHPAAAAVLAAQHRLAWDANPVADRMTAQAAAICAVATLLGPEGPIPAPDLRLGLLWQRPGTYYPLHNHDADETYVILAGQVQWTAGDDTRLRGAGEMIHHPSRMPHAFRTAAEGFVALWRWSGDVNTASYSFLDDPATTGAA